MGNRCVITNKEKTRAIYQHWNGGIDTIEPLLKVAQHLGGGFDKLLEISSKVFEGEEVSYGVSDYLDDNGVYIVNDDLEIIGREHNKQTEQRFHDPLRMALFIYLRFRINKSEAEKVLDLVAKVQDKKEQ